MQEPLHRLRGYIPHSFQAFREDWGCQKIAGRSLQILVEAMVEIGERLIAMADEPPAQTSADVLERLQRLGVVRDAQRYIPMVRFRNWLVHQYERVDLEILYGILTKKLGEIESFMKEVRDYLATH